MQFVTSKDFEGCPNDVEAAFKERRQELVDRLVDYDLDAYFLSDSALRGTGTIRANIESFNFERFSVEDRQHGGKYMAFCDLFKVLFLSFLYLHYCL